MSNHERDRFGQRPLYYAVRGGRLLCADRPARLGSEQAGPAALDSLAAAAALGGALPAKRSLFLGVGRVPPGWGVRLEDGEALLCPPPPLVAAPAGAQAAPLELLAALRAAVRRLRTAAACALSGGIDSGLVLSLAAEDAAPPRALTLASDFGDEAELRAAEAQAAGCGARHVLVRVEEQSLPDHLAETVRACEEPIWNGAAVARHVFFEQARALGEAALLSGVGADELLFGNPDAMRAWPERREAERALAESLLTETARQRLRSEPPAAPVAAAAAGSHELDALRTAFVESVLPDSTLPPECRTSEAAGVEARLPYLDAGFAAVALRLPASACCRDGAGKWPLREAARGLVPDAVRLAAKTPRLAPVGGGAPRARRRWLELYDVWLRPEQLAGVACVEPAKARGLLERFASGRSAAAARAVEDAILMRLVSLAMLAAPA